MLNKNIAIDIPRIIDIHTHSWTKDELPFEDIGDVLEFRLIRKGIEEAIEHIKSEEKEARVKDFYKIYNLNNTRRIIDAQYQSYAGLKLVGPEQALSPKLTLGSLMMNFDHADFKFLFSTKDKFRSQIKNAYAAAQNSGHEFLSIIPGLGIDARDPKMEQRTYEHFKNNFNLFKLYPALGFDLYDKKLISRFYPQLIESQGSIVCHCSPGGFMTLQNPIKVYNPGKDKYKYKLFDGRLVPDFLNKPDKRTWFNDPSNWKRTLQVITKQNTRYAELYVDLAHLGGGGNIKRFIKQLKDPTIDVTKFPEQDKTFTQKIIELCISDDFPNIYTDISSCISMRGELNEALEIIIQKYPKMADKILFGSDDYILKLSTDLNTDLKTFFGYWAATPERKKLLRKFVFENPQTFLHGQIK